MTQQLAAPALTAATRLTRLALPLRAQPSLATGRRCQRLSQRKEAGRIVGGHCGGAEANMVRGSQHAPVQGLSATPGPASLTAFPALSQPSEVSSPHLRRTGSPSLAEDPARCGGSLGGPGSPAAGGGILVASAARTPNAYNKTGPDALNVRA